MSDIDSKLKNALTDINQQWDDDIIPQLVEYIKIPNKSPAYDADWKQHGYMDQAMQLIVKWCEKQPIKGMKLELLESDNRTPLLFIDIPGDSDDIILLYGHMDKQPEMRGWRKDLGPWKPVIEDNKLYGRGGADDGYAVFASLSAIATLQQQNIPHAHCVLIVEGSEESGSPDLPHYLKQLDKKIGEPNLVICLDSNAGNYEQLWGTTSLRGLVSATLDISVLRYGVHSGYCSGLAPAIFNIFRSLLDRIDDQHNAEFKIDAFKVNIPQHRIDEAKTAGEILGDSFYEWLPLKDHAQTLSGSPADLLINNAWKPSLSITGMDNVPALKDAGSVSLPNIQAKLSIRIPPECDPEKAAAALKQTLETDPPYSCSVSCNIADIASGWNAPKLSEWLANANNHASELFYGKPAAYIGCGGTIPFMAMLGDAYPNAEFLITGVLGPKSNAHGPNEFLHIPYVKKLTGCVASVIASHYQHYEC